MPPEAFVNEQRLRVPQVCEIVGVSRGELYRMMGEGEFPRPLKSGHISFWASSDVDSWVRASIQKARDADLTENFLKAQLRNGGVPEPLLRQRAESYGVSWESVKAYREEGLVETENGMTAPRWSLRN